MYNYKYSCRDCRIRERCIDENDSPAHIKTMIRTAFEARTDTVSMWAILQKSCLLVQQDEERERQAGQESLLARRLREAREVPAQQADEASVAEEAEVAGQPEPADSIIIPTHQPTTTQFDPDDEVPAYLESSGEVEVVHSGADDGPGTVSLGTVQFDQPPISEETSLYWLILDENRRRISLPVNSRNRSSRFLDRTCRCVSGTSFAINSLMVLLTLLVVISATPLCLLTA